MLGVFDGHGGGSIAARLTSELPPLFVKIIRERFFDRELLPTDIHVALRATFRRMDDILRRSAPSPGAFDSVGSTATIVLLSPLFSEPTANNVEPISHFSALVKN